jgi:DNA recombination protein Rad52
MSLTEKQRRQLMRPLSAKAVKRKNIDGFEMHYIEGWFAIQEANKIFGFDGWSRETLHMTCLYAKPSDGGFIVFYSCKVRITVTANATSTYRDGSGFGQAYAKSLAVAHETAGKTAETDATKRALVTFGNRFGLSLYAIQGASHAPPTHQAIS